MGHHVSKPDKVTFRIGIYSMIIRAGSPLPSSGLVRFEGKCFYAAVTRKVSDWKSARR